MADVINLRQARKRRARQQSEAKAAENRVRFGRTAAEKAREAAEAEAARQHLDQHRREPGGPAEDPPADP